jgi:PRTRC genetic system protein A
MRELVEAAFSDPRDRASFAATPILPVPRFGALPPLAYGAARYLIAEDGIYIEGRTPAFHACARLAEAADLPVGPVSSHLTPAAGAVPQSLLEEAVAAARRAAPNEWAGAIVVQDGRYRLLTPSVRTVSPHRITYDALTIGDEQPPLVMDLHSHGHAAPFFSRTDDHDDGTNPAVVFVAGVVGHVGSDSPTWTWRVVINGRVFDRSLRGGQPLRTDTQETTPC